MARKPPRRRPDVAKLFPEHDAEELADVLLFDDMDGALIGLARQYSKELIAVYDADACIVCLVNQGMTHEQAVEWFEFNTAGAWVGERTPMLLTFRADRLSSGKPPAPVFQRLDGVT